MKPLFTALSVTLLLGTFLSAQAAEQTAPTNHSIQVHRKTDLTEWNRENTVEGQGPLPDSLAFTRRQIANQGAFGETDWLTLPPGTLIGQHGHIGNEDVYIIVSGKGLSTNSEGKQIEVDVGGITIARPGRSHTFKNIGKKPLILLGLIVETAGVKVVGTG